MAGQLLLQDQENEKMGPIGPWAFGRVEKKGDGALLTGLRPVVGTICSSLLEPAEWKHAHRALMEQSTASRQLYDNVAAEARSSSCQMLTDLERLNKHATCTLRERSASVRCRIDELALIEQQMAREIRQLLPIPPRLRRAQDAMALTYSVATECIAIRRRRPDSELKADEVEQLLMIEASTAHEGRCLAARCAAQIEEQIATCRDAMSRLHADWSLKNLALFAERRAITQGLEEAPLKIAGAASAPDIMGPPPEEWEKKACLLLQWTEEERGRSVHLRSKAEPSVREAGRDMARRSALVDDALNRNIDVLVATVIEVEAELSKVLRRQAAAEALCAQLHKSAWRTEPALKTAQSRLAERRFRPPPERTPDEPQRILMHEVGTALAMDTAIKERLSNTQKCLQDLLDKRAHLERELHLKSRALHLDRDRVRTTRFMLPKRTALQGMD